MLAPRWVRVRLVIVGVAITALFAAIGRKAYSVQIEDGARMTALGQAQYLQSVEIPAPRGSIRDANGVELAVSVNVDSIYANPREVVDVAGTSAALARALGLDVRDVEARLSSRKYFQWIKRRVPPEDARRVRELDLPGIGLASESKRFYPGRSLAGPVLGFADIDGKGIEGIELFHDKVLKGERQAVPALRDGRGQLVLAEGVEERHVAGATVTLTIDRFVQYAAEQALAAAIEEHKAKAGIVVVLDPRTGEVLALASSPTYDPNDPRDRKDARNRALTDAYEPGSVMKVFSIAAAVEAGIVDEQDMIDVEGGRLQIGRKTIRDTHTGDQLISVTEVMKYSSNVGTVKIVRRLGKEKLHAALRRFGFGDKTGIQLPGERSGLIRDTKRWGEIGTATISFGYGLLVTPLQIARALGAVANGGMLLEPTVVKRIVAADGSVVYEHRPEARRVISPASSAKLVRMLKTVHEKGGTAEKVKIPGFVAAGKTGTAHKVDPATGRYAPDKYLSSFIGFVPADDPRLVIVVQIDEPSGGKYYGGSVAGPVFARVAIESLKYLGVAGTVPPELPAVVGAGQQVVPAAELEPAPAVEEAVALEGTELIEAEPGSLPPAGPGEPIVVIPDFRGMSMGQALAAARDAGVKIELDGSGVAVRQFPGPGRAMRHIACRVTFERP